LGVIIKGKTGNKYNFTRSYSNTGSLRDKSGIYAILCEVDGKTAFN